MLKLDVRESTDHQHFKDGETEGRISESTRSELEQKRSIHIYCSITDGLQPPSGYKWCQVHFINWEYPSPAQYIFVHCQLIIKLLLKDLVK